MIYFVKSKTKAFRPFKIEDNGLGYLVFNCCEKIAELKFGELGKILGSRVSGSDILIRPQGKQRWYAIKYEKNSSIDYLEHKTETIRNGTVIKSVIERIEHRIRRQ